MFSKSKIIPKLKSAGSISFLFWLVMYAFSIVTAFLLTLVYVSQKNSIDINKLSMFEGALTFMALAVFFITLVFAITLHFRLRVNIRKQSLSVAEFVQEVVNKEESELKEFMRKNKDSKSLQVEIAKNILINKVVSEEEVIMKRLPYKPESNSN